ncbi:hypothetical protein ONA91_23685 [Micromonospora sp. DR5-3]|uniref:hypothetical protein n=1 Tax=Micromonospora sp. DR5-3 TaxID=2992129 RepID=UPI00222EFDCD|nr:hypothetical protein [Micromonospora sp. DR5-3]MCW3817458.1 hypothetical protein [Micromonospora sp. DR5-3]
MRDEIRHVSARRSNLNTALAWAAARWAVDQAIASRATVVYVEDLRSLEAKGMGTTLNTRLSQQVRGQIADRMRHLAAETGIAVVTTPARNTSKHQRKSWLSSRSLRVSWIGSLRCSRWCGCVGARVVGSGESVAGRRGRPVGGGCRSA